jgi:hypothetical protein
MDTCSADSEHVSAFFVSQNGDDETIRATHQLQKMLQDQV